MGEGLLHTIKRGNMSMLQIKDYAYNIQLLPAVDILGRW